MTIPSIYISTNVLIALALGIFLGYKLRPLIQVWVANVKKSLAGALGAPKS